MTRPEVSHGNRSSTTTRLQARKRGHACDVHTGICHLNPASFPPGILVPLHSSYPQLHQVLATGVVHRPARINGHTYTPSKGHCAMQQCSVGVWRGAHERGENMMPRCMHNTTAHHVHTTEPKTCQNGHEHTCPRRPVGTGCWTTDHCEIEPHDPRRHRATPAQSNCPPDLA
jgi:hypothetical protein